MFKKIILLNAIILFRLAYSQVIYHEISDDIISGTPHEINVLVDLEGQTISQFELFFRTDSQISFFRQLMTQDDFSNYTSVIPPELIQGDYIEYYIVLETLNDSSVTIPENDPEKFPIRVKINKLDVEENVLNLLDSDISILSPLVNSNNYAEDVLISLSYFRLDNVDINSTEIWLDDINMTSRSMIFNNHLTLEPPLLVPGYHKVEILMKNKQGISFLPVIWSFNIIDDSIDYSDKFSYSGRLWNDYTDNIVDDVSSDYNILNFDFKINSEWINIKSKFKKSSLENNLEQPRDRYSILLNNKILNLHFGDFYPKVGQFGINGNRIRGFGLNLKTKYFQLNLVNGDLFRSVQGDPNNGAVEISDYFNQYNENSQIDEDILSLSRNNYTFRKEISAIRLSVGNFEKFSFGFNLLKAKDNINSVNKEIDNAVVILTDEFNIYNSDQFLDKNDNDEFDDDIDSLYFDINGNGIFDSFTDLTDSSQFQEPDTNLIIIGTVDDFYVKHNAEDETWKECLAPNTTATPIYTGFNVTTMPHRLIRVYDNQGTPNKYFIFDFSFFFKKSSILLKAKKYYLCAFYLYC